jgi:short-subunit dehydrogenase
MTTHQNLGTALITGGSTGIGAIYADRLARLGHDLILVARNGAHLDDFAARLRLETGRKVETVAADLADPAGRARVETILRTDDSIEVLVNNAGVGAVEPLIDSDPERMQEIITVNVAALVALTQAAVPGMVARGSGKIINMASIVGLAPEMLNGVYAASKAFVIAFSQSLHHELADRGIRVQAVLPGATATDFWRLSGRPVEELPPEIVMAAENMVDAAIAGLFQGEVVTIPALPDIADWESFEAARRALGPNLSRAEPAARYRAGAAASVSQPVRA